jgi:iron(III) transport system permease protein
MLSRAVGVIPAAAVAVLIIVLSLAPLLRVLGEGAASGLTGLIATLSTPATQTAILNTAEIALSSTLLAGALGGAFACAVVLTDMRGRSALAFLFTLLLVMPSQVTAIAWIELLGPSSPILAPLGLAPAAGTPNPLFGPGGITLLMGIEHAPLVFLTFAAGLRAIPPEQIAAARSLGAGALRVLLRVVLPLALPSLLAGLALAFVSAVGNFGTVALLGIPGRFPVLTTLIYRRLTGFGPSALSGVAALSLVLLALAGAGLVIESVLLRRQTLALRGGRTIGANAQKNAWRYVIASLCWLVVLVLLVVPLSALAGTALVRAYGLRLGVDTITLSNLLYVLFQHAAMRRALVNSCTLAASAAAVLLLLSVLAGYFAVRREMRAMRMALAVADLPYTLPGVVLAIGCILLFLRPVLGVALYDTLGIMLVAYLARFLTLAQRPVAAAFRRIDPLLEHAAQASGAGALRRMFTIVLPLVAPSALAGALMVFVLAFNELTVSVLLWSTGNETVGVVVFGLEQAGENTLAAAASLVSVASTLLVMALAGLLARRLPRGTLPWQA